MTKELNGGELAGFIKERQARLVRSLKAQKISPRLVILRDSDDPVIKKYVSLKQRYGADIGIVVEDQLVETSQLSSAIKSANANPAVSAIIVQLPLQDPSLTDQIVAQIAPEKDVDGLSGKGHFDSATATAINWLLSSYNVNLTSGQIALVGRGRLVGAPLETMFKNSGYHVQVFHRGDDLSVLKNFDIIITATGVPGLIKSEYIKSGATVVDAGTASEDGVLKGDLADDVRTRTDLDYLTPKIGGVGPLTIATLFENVLFAAQAQARPKP
ncbi:bifunctional 5,10-methylenetetrahydrofolate dehydrogenase/5,10-methenyltetrahydrofolate cyclohydrolase [Candidatus Saccharibacteria bacterium]|nr:bifunctional 5,10-methylenetetrahydrofolate dehydrogenase/5,10-methenyltetrahydrofolate cyclohydrolase [Candidatus Saccharibacteria bacterium]